MGRFKAKFGYVNCRQLTGLTVETEERRKLFATFFIGEVGTFASKSYNVGGLGLLLCSM